MPNLPDDIIPDEIKNRPHEPQEMSEPIKRKRPEELINHRVEFRPRPKLRIFGQEDDMDNGIPK